LLQFEKERYRPKKHEPNVTGASIRILFLFSGSILATICILFFTIPLFIPGYAEDHPDRPSWLISLTFFSDLLIAASYFSIPMLLVYIAYRRKDVPFNWLFWLFALFIIFCGFTHLVHVFDAFVMNAFVKLITGLISFGTAVALIRLIPVALKLPSMAQLEKEILEREEAQIRMLRAEREREKAQKESDRAKSLFFANISHEIRTPLSGIVGLTELLSQSQGLPAEEAEIVRHISISAEILLQIVNDVLDASKLDDGKMEVERIPFSLNACLETVEAVFRLKVRSKNLFLKFDAETDIEDLKLIGDPGRIKQALLNLVGNATKFTTKGGITISARLTEKKDNHVVIKLEVSDTGIGIPQSAISRLFKSFTQVDASTTRKYGGTGLGLFITRQFIELMGGSIGCTSREGVGTNFTMIIPFELYDPATHGHLPTDNANELAVPEYRPEHFVNVAGSAKVLVVDDNDVNQKIAVKLLAGFGFKNVDLVDDGEKAVHATEEKEYDLVFMDCQMPRMDGYTATKEIRFREEKLELRRTLIVGLTANCFKSDEVQCLSCGMDSFVRKPLSHRSLGNILGTYLLKDQPIILHIDSPRYSPR